MAQDSSEYEVEFETALLKVENAIVLEPANSEMTEGSEDEPERLESDMDGWDFAVCLASAAISAFLTTSEAFEKWLAEVHDAASKQSGNYDFLQTILGKLFAHKGDNMDWFKTRDESTDPYRLFHRLLWGHDPLSRESDNPFLLMFAQKEGMAGLLQAVRHLIADTFSKQGLPFPGSSYFDYTNKDGKPWNYLIDLVQELSQEVYGNKAQAEAIYEHLLTIRAQDIAGGMAVIAVTSSYLKLRNITNDIRTAQVRLVAYTMSFYAEAIVGAAKQKGVPYINIPLGAAMAKELTSLMIASNNETAKLGRRTKELDARAETLIGQHNRLKALMFDEDINLYLEAGQDER